MPTSALPRLSVVPPAILETGDESSGRAGSDPMFSPPLSQSSSAGGNGKSSTMSAIRSASGMGRGNDRQARFALVGTVIKSLSIKGCRGWNSSSRPPGKKTRPRSFTRSKTSSGSKDGTSSASTGSRRCRPAREAGRRQARLGSSVEEASPRIRRRCCRHAGKNRHRDLAGQAARKAVASRPSDGKSKAPSWPERPMGGALSANRFSRRAPFAPPTGRRKSLGYFLSRGWSGWASR
jgi:hypothetical protein